MTHGRAVPALAYRFDTADGSVVFSGDTTVNDDLIALAQGADILVHQVADLGYLERHGITGAALERMAALHTDVTEVGGVAERARVRELILSHYLPAEPDAITDAEWANAPGRASAGQPPRAATACAERSLAFLRDHHPDLARAPYPAGPARAPYPGGQGAYRLARSSPKLIGGLV